MTFSVNKCKLSCSLTLCTLNHVFVADTFQNNDLSHYISLPKGFGKSDDIVFSLFTNDLTCSYDWHIECKRKPGIVLRKYISFFMCKSMAHGKMSDANTNTLAKFDQCEIIQWS